MTALSLRRLGAALLTCALLAPAAHAGLFDDDEARKAILDLRQKIEQANDQQRAGQAELNEQLSQLKRSLLDLNAQIETLRADNARLRGQDEQRAREVAELQRILKDTQQGVDDRIRRFEPQKVSLDGREFMVEPSEKRMYDEAMEVFRRGEFAAAASALESFQRSYPSSGYSESVLFWLGNAYYGKRAYKDAITSFRAVVASFPDSARAPEALLSVASCQAELKDAKGARSTIGELLKRYPNSEAAQAGRERLAALK
ncbi:tol-pal system protein YbgF [Piscinibacter sp.]|uniref:tol-pal system protein YbgF n=1 Tax=Piscinibacter sp. TaxID=1903157 RepID=UPI002BB889F4|nr:tol-pal system protein YbgF [Albitalea sp.]HUG21928.1 tol-pal system protein YbgF [Albitalea sp.]